MYAIENILEIIGNDDQIREIRKFIKEDRVRDFELTFYEDEEYEDGFIVDVFYTEEDGAYIDFEKIMPIPEEIFNSRDWFINDKIAHQLLFGSIPDLCSTKYHFDCISEERDENGNRIFDKNTCLQNKFKKLSDAEKRESFENALIMQSNHEKYGAVDLYHWCLDNWGTDLNAFHQYLISENTIGFITKDYSASYLIVKLSTIFPDVIFKLEKIEAEDRFFSIRDYGFYNISCYSFIDGTENHCYRRDYGQEIPR